MLDPEFLANDELFDYEVMVFNYCNWQREGLSKKAQANFKKYLSDGGGLVIIHFSNGAFHASLPDTPPSDWPEYRNICRRVWDHGQGKSGHDPYGRFTVDVTGDHPITHGLNSFETIDEKSNAEVFQIWDQSQRQTNFILRAGLVDNHRFDGIFPFLDLEYIRFVLSVPMKWRLGQTMYRAVIHRLGPEIRDVPSANDGLRLRRTPFLNRLECATKLRYRRWRRLLRKSMRRRSRSQVRPQAKNSRIAPRPSAVLSEFLKSDEFDATIFNRSGIGRVLAGEAQLSRRQIDLLQTLETFAVGLRMFVNRPVAQCPSDAEQGLTVP